MKLFLFLVVVTFLGACSNPAHPAQNDHNNHQTDSSQTTDSTQLETSLPSTSTTITGTYTFGDQEGTQGGGYLAIEQLEDNQLKFELDLNNGAPSYHSGSMTGTMTLENNVAVFTTSEYSEEDPCKITFTFANNTITIEQEKGSEFSCGFGQGVVARGVYNKQQDQAVFKYEGGLK